MRKRKSKSSFCQVDHLELRQLLSATIYVSAAATGATHDGASWATAFTGLQSGLTAAAGEASSSNPVIIEVGQGTYNPTSTTGPRTASFQLIDDVSIQGGYAGAGQANADARDVTLYPTILSGDIGTPGVDTDNSYHVVTASGTDNTAVLDGLTITDGNANGGGSNTTGGGILDNAGNPIISNCTITGNTGDNGGGIFNIYSSSPTLTNCTITGNTAAGSGGGMYNTNYSSPILTDCTLSGNTAGFGEGGGIFNIFSSSPTLTNCTISGNTADNQGGGGIFNAYSSSPTLTNCTLSGNTALFGGGMENFDSSPTLTNCILWGDAASFNYKEIDNLGGTPTITYSDIDQSGYAGSNIDSDPLFISSSNLRLQAGSPAIGAGNAGASGLSGVTTDLDGLPRIVDGSVDMGAYESHYEFQSTIYVDASATGGNTGSDWADAYPSLAVALDYAVSGETIDVAQGTYYPTAGTDRTATFQLMDDVSIQGGYAGAGQANPDAHNVTEYPTILSGGIGTTGSSGYSYHVVTASGTDNTAVLDGFTITDGVSNGGDSQGGGIYDNAGSPTISDCTISRNTATDGGGIYIGNDSSPILTNCIISGNSALQSGGGIYDNAGSPTISDCTISGNTADEGGGGIFNIFSSSPTLINCTISGNTADDYGGGIFNAFSSPTLTNCTISGNAARWGGGMYNDNSFPTLTNCILWGDAASLTDNEIYNLGSGTATITYSDIDQSGYAGSNNNIDSDPLFISSSNLRLQAGSPAIGAGNAGASGLSGVTTDLDGLPRTINGKVDMGAYESHWTTDSTVYVDASATAMPDGESWQTAYPNLSLALIYVGNGDTVEVAQGTYYPTAGTDRTATFQLIDNVAIEGGFAGQADPTAAQNPATYPTILSGDIGTLGVNTDNSYHVVTGSGTNSTAVLDGFTITDGNANGGGSNANGGGIFDNAGSPTISNCTISGNSAQFGGGMFNLVSSPTLTNCTISRNTASSDGGGIYDNAGSPTISDCTISRNTATNGGGGGIFNIYSSSPTLINCTISGNTAGNQGGGGISNISSSSPTLINCTISGNTAGGGGGILNAYSSPTLTNCILWGDTASPTDNEIDNVGSGTATITYSDIDGGYAGAGNIDSDPHFIRNVGTNGPTDYGDLELQGASPAINAGSNAAVPMGVTTDLAGNPRISDGTVDLGAYETQAHLAITAQPTGSVTAGSIFSVTVKVEDPEGNAITNDNSNFTLTLGTGGPAGASLNGTLNATADDGVASFTGLSLDRAGTYSLASSNSNLPVTTSNNFTITAAAPAALVITQQPGDSTAGQDIPAVQVEVEDQYGNLADGSSVNVALSGSTGASLGGTTTLATSGGVASFSDLAITQAGSYTLSITDGDLPGLTSSSFTIDPAAAAKLAFTLEPANTTAGQTMPNFAVEVQDQYGNLITSDTSTVAIASTPAGISTSIAAVDGIAIFVGVTPDTAGTFTLSASDGSLAEATSSHFTIDPAAAAKLAFTLEPANATAGQTMANFAVEVQDQYGNLVTSNTSTVAIASAPAGISTSIAATDGIATFTGLSTDTAGTFTLSASDGSLAGATSSSFTIAPGAAATLVITQQPASTLAGQNIPIQVEVEDQYGNPVDGTSVNVAISGSTGASLGGTTELATSGGVASFANLAITQEGTYTLSITDGDLPGLTSSSFTINPAAAAKLAFVLEPADTNAGQTMPNFAVEVQDQYGNLITSDTSTVTIASTPAGITTSIAATDGIAIFTGLSTDTAGTYTLSASDGALAGATSSSFTISPAAAAKLVVTQQPGNGVAGQTMANFAVEVEDQYGNPVDGTSVTLALAGSAPSGAILAGTLTEPTAGGIAAFSDLSLNRAGSDYTLSASDGSLPAVTTQSFAITYAGPQLVFAAEPANAVAGGKLPAFTINTDDTAGNVITTGKSTVILTLSSAGKIYGTTKAKVKNGVASFKNISLHTAGTYTLTAADSSYASGISTEFTISAGAAKKLIFDPQPQNAAAASPFNVSVELVNQYGNAVNDGSTVDLVLGSHPKTAASLSSTAAVSDGFADFDDVTLDTAGPYTLTASDGKLKATSKKFVVN